MTNLTHSFLMYLFHASTCFEQQVIIIRRTSSGGVPVKTGTPNSHPPECVMPDDALIKFGPPDDEHLLLETCRGMK
jgi:hypothetical protein